MMRKTAVSKRRNDRGKTLVRLSMTIALSLLVLAAAMATTQAAAGVTTASLDFETLALDLDTGNIVELGPFDLTSPDGADVYLAYNADRAPHAVVFIVGDGTEIAVMHGVAFELATLADIGSLEFSIEPPDVPFAPSDTVVIRTGDGSVFKLGNAIETEEWVTFDYDLLQ